MKIARHDRRSFQIHGRGQIFKLVTMALNRALAAPCHAASITWRCLAPRWRCRSSSARRCASRRTMRTTPTSSPPCSSSRASSRCCSPRSAWGKKGLPEVSSGGRQYRRKPLQLLARNWDGLRQCGPFSHAWRKFRIRGPVEQNEHISDLIPSCKHKGHGIHGHDFYLM